MKVPLVDGWQNAKLNWHRHTVSKRDEAMIDAYFDEMHESNRVQSSKDPSPFALPVFVVWSTVHGVEKGRVVVDLRPLNKWAVPDAYPLPL